MDSIFIKNLRLQGKHGVYKDERKVEQEFLLEITLSFDTRKSSLSGELEDTVDYAQVRDIATEVIAGTSEYLVERLADTIAKQILKDTRIHNVQITIAKTGVWQNGTPGVSISREQKDYTQ